MEIIGYQNEKQKYKKKCINDIEKLKELWNKSVYEVFRKEKSISEYKECYEYVCKELRSICLSEEEYNKEYNELRLDCYMSLLYVLEAKVYE